MEATDQYKIESLKEQVEQERSKLEPLYKKLERYKLERDRVRADFSKQAIVF